MSLGSIGGGAGGVNPAQMIKKLLGKSQKKANGGAEGQAAQALKPAQPVQQAQQLGKPQTMSQMS